MIICDILNHSQRNFVIEIKQISWSCPDPIFFKNKYPNPILIQNNRKYPAEYPILNLPMLTSAVNTGFPSYCSETMEWERSWKVRNPGYLEALWRSRESNHMRALSSGDRGQGCNEGSKGSTITRSANHYGGMTAWGAENCQQCHKYFLHCTTFASERPQVRTWERQTCFLPRSPPNLVTPLTEAPLKNVK